MKKVIAFDLDGTLAPSKSPLPDRMSKALNELLCTFEVCVISGGRFTQFQTQLLSNLHIDDERLEKLHLMPTCGTQYYNYNKDKQDWTKVYAENFTNEEKAIIINQLEKAIDELQLRETKVYGETIEDRDSQITFSALGQDIVSTLGEEGLRVKEAWDPKNEKKQKLRDYLAPLLPNFEVRVGGVSSIDITKPGIDKAYGMNKLIHHLSLKSSDILFIGDRLEEGGNDYPVLAMGIDSIAISDWRETASVVEAICHVA